jgi:aspartyl-tRNA synthetase
VLPQSPQIAKQLLMVGGCDRYYQVARCMRDEDLRSDRQFEFTQVDIEASFVEQSDVLEFVADCVLEATRAVSDETPPPVARLTWAEAMDRYGSDKPDLRFGMELSDLTAALAGTSFNAFRAPYVGALRVEGEAGASRSRLDGMVERAKSLGAKGLVWMRVTPGSGLESPVSKFLSEPEMAAIVSGTGAGPGDLLLLVADERRPAQLVLGQLRNDLGRPPVGQGPYRYAWIVDFPLFETTDDAGRPVPAHHPFTMPHPEDMDLLEDDPLAVRSQSYDLVVNGWELGSGSIRIHRPDVQARIFRLLGISDEQAEARFGFLLGAFRYGAPPHGGFAFGLDRLVAVLAGEENIREVIAFPKSQSGSDPMTGAPKPVDPKVLRELGIRVQTAP